MCIWFVPSSYVIPVSALYLQYIGPVSVLLLQPLKIPYSSYLYGYVCYCLFVVLIDTYIVAGFIKLE